MNIVELHARNKAQPYQPKTDYDPTHFRFRREQSQSMRSADLIPSAPPISSALRNWIVGGAVLGFVFAAWFAADAWRAWVS